MENKVLKLSRYSENAIRITIDGKSELCPERLLFQRMKELTSIGKKNNCKINFELED